MHDVDKYGVPYWSVEELECEAENILHKIDDRVLTEPQPTPLRDYVVRLSSEHKLQFKENVPFPPLDNGMEKLGAYHPKTLTILISARLTGDIRYSFTLAHEFSHFVLHKNLDVRKVGYRKKLEDNEKRLSTTTRPSSNSRISRRTSQEWMEWQANRLAAALLMPRATFGRALIQVQDELGINPNRGIVFRDSNIYNINDYKSTIVKLSVIYKVSAQSAGIRLNQLGYEELGYSPRFSFDRGWNNRDTASDHSEIIIDTPPF